jgi:hypothetical protein
MKAVRKLSLHFPTKAEHWDLLVSVIVEEDFTYGAKSGFIQIHTFRVVVVERIWVARIPITGREVYSGNKVDLTPSGDVV